MFLPYPDTGTPPANVVAAGKACAGGTPNFVLLGQSINCMYDDWGNQITDNTFSHNGGLRNPTNGDLGELTLEAGHPVNCYRHNIDTGGALTSSPAGLQQRGCGGAAGTADANGPFLAQVLCNSQVFGAGLGCSPGSHYPRHTRVVMHPLPKRLASMPNPCTGVPANPWCPARRRSHRGGWGPARS